MEIQLSSCQTKQSHQTPLARMPCTTYHAEADRSGGIQFILRGDFMGHIIHQCVVAGSSLAFQNNWRIPIAIYICASSLDGKGERREGNDIHICVQGWAVSDDLDRRSCYISVPLPAGHGFCSRRKIKEIIHMMFSVGHCGVSLCIRTSVTRPQ